MLHEEQLRGRNIYVGWPKMQAISGPDLDAGIEVQKMKQDLEKMIEDQKRNNDQQT